MNTGLHRIELATLGGLGGPFQRTASAAFASQINLLWRQFCRAVGHPDGRSGVHPEQMVASVPPWSDVLGPVRLITAASAALEPAAAVQTAPTPDDASFYPDTASPDAVAADGLTILSQSWRRGGLGSNALMTFTLRNSNDFAVKDIEISCAFSRRDGSHLTDRTRVIHDTVKMKGRRSFAHWHVGFVNVYADRVKCTPVAASRI